MEDAGYLQGSGLITLIARNGGLNPLLPALIAIAFDSGVIGSMALAMG